jgi:hypothetical protein
MREASVVPEIQAAEKKPMGLLLAGRGQLGKPDTDATRTQGRRENRGGAISHATLQS